VIVELILKDGIGNSRPLVLQVNQILIRQDTGTPIGVAAEYGGGRSQAISIVGQDDFNRMLRNLGIGETVVCDRLELPKPPPGARLIAGPKPGE